MRAYRWTRTAGRSSTGHVHEGAEGRRAWDREGKGSLYELVRVRLSEQRGIRPIRSRVACRRSLIISALMSSSRPVCTLLFIHFPCLAYKITFHKNQRATFLKSLLEALNAFVAAASRGGRPSAINPFRLHQPRKPPTTSASPSDLLSCRVRPHLSRRSSRLFFSVPSVSSAHLCILVFVWSGTRAPSVQFSSHKCFGVLRFDAGATKTSESVRYMPRISDLSHLVSFDS